MKNSLLIFGLFIFLIVPNVKAQVTFSEDIAEIIFNNCTSCHRPGEIAPISFTNYEEIKNWGQTIKHVTQTKYMPPWSPEKSYSSFLGERGLTDEEINKIATWVDNGYALGNGDLIPELPSFPEGSQIGEPDLVLTFEEAFMHEGNNEDNYRVFVLPTNLNEDVEVAGVELRPGNPQIVHHALFAYDTSGEGQQLDNQDPDYGYDGFGGFGINGVFDKQLPGYVPGQRPYLYPESLGKKLPANADLLVQMHYAPSSTNELDSSTVNIFFKKEPVERQVNDFIMLPFAWSNTVLDKPFILPANQEITFHGTYEIPTKVSILGIAPHSHLLGQHWEVYIEEPDGTITPLINIPKWDFNWQGAYYFDKFKIATAGSKIHAIASYDNTSNNPSNPSNPPKQVSWGEKTTDEMYYLPIQYVFYKDGDEDIVFDDMISNTPLVDLGLDYGDNQLFDPFPNPTNEIFNINFSLNRTQRVHLTLSDMKGNIHLHNISNKLFTRGKHSVEIDVSNIPVGLHTITLKTDQGFNKSKNIIITH